MKRALLLCLVVFLGLLNIANAADAKAYTDALKVLTEAETKAKKDYDDAVTKAAEELDDKKKAKNADLAAAVKTLADAKKALADNKDDTKTDDLKKAVATAETALKTEALKIDALKKLDDSVTAATKAVKTGPTCEETITAFTDDKCTKAPTKDAKTGKLPDGVEDALKMTKDKTCVDLADGAKDVLSVKVKSSLMEKKDGSCKVIVEKYSDKACKTVLTKDATADLKSKDCTANPFVPGGFAKVGEVKVADKTKDADAGKKNTTADDKKKEEGSGAGMYILIAVIVVVVCAAGFFAYKKFGAGAKTD